LRLRRTGPVAEVQHLLAAKLTVLDKRPYRRCNLRLVGSGDIGCTPPCPIAVRPPPTAKLWDQTLYSLQICAFVAEEQPVVQSFLAPVALILP
jgi:hypothetical protein